MKKKYKVQWALPANLDLLEIAERIAEDNPITARKILKKIKNQVSNLKIAPERGRVVPELAEYGIRQFRELIISPWRILYQIDEKVVYVVLVLDCRRNLEDILFKRLLR